MAAGWRVSRSIGYAADLNVRLVSPNESRGWVTKPLASIYPTQEQKLALAKAFGYCRSRANRSLKLTTEAYRQTGKGISGLTLKKMLPQWKRELE